MQDKVWLRKGASALSELSATWAISRVNIWILNFFNFIWSKLNLYYTWSVRALWIQTWPFLIRPFDSNWTFTILDPFVPYEFKLYLSWSVQAASNQTLPLLISESLIQPLPAPRANFISPRANFISVDVCALVVVLYQSFIRLRANLTSASPVLTCA